MHYYEVLIADSRYHSGAPLTYGMDRKLPLFSIVTVPLKQRAVTGFVTGEVDKPDFKTKDIKAVVSDTPLPKHCLELARWLSEYYQAGLGETLRQFAPTKPAIRMAEAALVENTGDVSLALDAPLTDEQKRALSQIKNDSGTTVLLHGETGSGKTRVYLELAKQTLLGGKSVLLLTPEISLTPQLALAAKRFINQPVFVLHSQMSTSDRKKVWKQILESKEPIAVIGPRSALFAPLANIGLIVIDEAHEPAYKQEQSPRYQASRVASQLGTLTGAKVILGTATPLLTDYYLANEKGAIVRMSQPAAGTNTHVNTQIIDMRQRENFSRSPYLANVLINELSKTLARGKQSLLYLNRRGSARLILCKNCGWEMLCPNCDIPLVYHGDEHNARCHICGYSKKPPTNCPQCANPEIIYKSIGTKALVEAVSRLFPQARIARFDSDNIKDEHLVQIYDDMLKGKFDILIGTQILAKGLDLPKLELVGIISAETSMALPDYTSEERSFQLLYQVMGRVGRGHAHGTAVIQTHNPNSPVIRAAVNRDFQSFYEYALAERRQFRFPPFSYLLQLSCRRLTEKGAAEASLKLKNRLLKAGLPVEIIGPSPSFYKRRGRYFYYQLILKSKQRGHLVKLAQEVPPDWRVNLDPMNLL